MTNRIGVLAAVVFTLGVPGQSVTAATISESRLAELMSSTSLQAVSLESLRARDKEILEELAMSLATRYSDILAGSEMVFTRLSESGSVFYRLDFVGLRNRDRARALCEILEMERCIARIGSDRLTVLEVRSEPSLAAIAIVEDDVEPFDFYGEEDAPVANPASRRIEASVRSKLDPLGVFPEPRPDLSRYLDLTIVTEPAAVVVTETPRGADRALDPVVDPAAPPARLVPSVPDPVVGAGEPDIDWIDETAAPAPERSGPRAAPVESAGPIGPAGPVDPVEPTDPVAPALDEASPRAQAPAPDVTPDVTPDAGAQEFLEGIEDEGAVLHPVPLLRPDPAPRRLAATSRPLAGPDAPQKLTMAGSDFVEMASIETAIPAAPAARRFTATISIPTIASIDLSVLDAATSRIEKARVVLPGVDVPLAAPRPAEAPAQVAGDVAAEAPVRDVVAGSTAQDVVAGSTAQDVVAGEPAAEVHPVPLSRAPLLADLARREAEREEERVLAAGRAAPKPLLRSTALVSIAPQPDPVTAIAALDPAPEAGEVEVEVEVAMSSRPLDPTPLLRPASLEPPVEVAMVAAPRNHPDPSLRPDLAPVLLAAAKADAPAAADEVAQEDVAPQVAQEVVAPQVAQDETMPQVAQDEAAAVLVAEAVAVDSRALPAAPLLRPARHASFVTAEPEALQVTRADTASPEAAPVETASPAETKAADQPAPRMVADLEPETVPETVPVTGPEKPVRQVSMLAETPAPEASVQIARLGKVTFDDRYARPAQVDFQDGRASGRLQKLPFRRPDLSGHADRPEPGRPIRDTYAANQLLSAPSDRPFEVAQVPDGALPEDAPFEIVAPETEAAQPRSGADRLFERSADAPDVDATAARDLLSALGRRAAAGDEVEAGVEAGVEPGRADAGTQDDALAGAEEAPLLPRLALTPQMRVGATPDKAVEAAAATGATGETGPGAPALVLTEDMRVDSPTPVETEDAAAQLRRAQEAFDEIVAGNAAAQEAADPVVPPAPVRDDSRARFAPRVTASLGDTAAAAEASSWQSAMGEPRTDLHRRAHPYGRINPADMLTRHDPQPSAIAPSGLRIELAYAASREQVLTRVTEFRRTFPKMVLEQGRFFGARVHGGNEQFIVGFAADDVAARDDVVWYLDQVGLPWKLR